MAEQKTNTRRSNTRKPANAKKEAETETKVEAKKETVEKKVEAKEEKPSAKAKVKLAKDDKVPVMNNTTGRYGYVGRSGYSFELEEYGDITDVPFGELQTMRSGSQKRHLEDAFIIILDEDAVEELNYAKLYENVLDEEGVNELLGDVDRLEKALSKMPLVMRETVVTIAKRKYEARELYDIRVIEAIEKNLNVKIIG